MIKSSAYIALALLAGGKLFAQGVESEDSDHGVTFYERFQGSVNTLGAVNELDTSIGYKFNSHFGVDGGIPVYFVRPSTSTTSTTTTSTAGPSSANGIGNVYSQVRLTLANPVLNFESTVTATAPTGDKATGFSTGHATVDWSNYFDHSFSHLTPFVGVGLANSVSDTMFFVRPYTTYGLVTHVEGGARYQFAHMFTVGASIYEIAPTGQQTVVSRLVKAKSQGAAPGSRKNQGVFETNNLTTGSSDIAKDHGLSTLFQVQPVKALSLFCAFTRSTQYALNTVSFGVGFNLGSAIRSMY